MSVGFSWGERKLWSLKAFEGGEKAGHSWGKGQSLHLDICPQDLQAIAPHNIYVLSAYEERC